MKSLKILQNAVHGGEKSMNSQNLELIKVKIENEISGLMLNIKKKALSASEWQITKSGRYVVLFGLMYRQHGTVCWKNKEVINSMQEGNVKFR